MIDAHDQPEVFHFSDWTEESKSSEGMPLPENPENPVNELFSTQPEARNQEIKQKAYTEAATVESEVHALEQLRSPEQSLNAFLNLMPESKTTRQGITQQSNSQKIIKFTTNAHPAKNLPAQIFRKIKNYLKEVGRQHLLNGETKRFSVTELNDFIMNSGLTLDDWDEILDLVKICAQIDKSKKLGTSKHFNEISSELRNFLIYLNKKVQKIVYRSAKRVIIQLLGGAVFSSYLDSEAHMELHQLDKELMSSGEHSTKYRYFLSQLNKFVTKTKNHQ